MKKSLIRKLGIALMLPCAVVLVSSVILQLCIIVAELRAMDPAHIVAGVLIVCAGVGFWIYVCNLED